MGGPDKVRRQHEGGKLTVRERIERLLDAGSFHEIGGLAGGAKYGAGGELAEFSPANLIFGRGRIGGRPVAVTGDDFTVRGGADDGDIKDKLLAVERMACDLRPPLVRLVDGTGGGSVKNMDDEAASEDDAFERARKFLSYLPGAVHELAARLPSDDDPARSDPWLIEAVPRDPRKVYNMRKIIASFVDRDAFFEMGKLWGRPIIPGFARLAGCPVAVMAGDPMHFGGARTARAPEKITRLVDLAQVFHLPLVQLVDCPGFLIGPEAEKEATIRYGMRVAWPSAEWGSLPIASGQARRNRAAYPQVRFALSRRRAQRHRGNHRPARHAQDPLRIRRTGHAAAHAGAQYIRGAALTGLAELAALLAGVESMSAAEIGSHAIYALTWIQEKPEYGAITTQLAIVAINLKNLK